MKGRCVSLSYLAIIYLNNGKILLDYFNEMFNMEKENKRKLITQFEKYLLCTFFD